MAESYSKNKIRNHLLADIAVIFFSVIVAVWLAKSEFFGNFIASATENGGVLASFFAGFFFTSAFTTAPAMVALGEIAIRSGAVVTAVFGGMGALCGDLIIFLFIRDRLAEDVKIISGSGSGRRLRKIFHRKIFRFLTPFVGALIIASPLPDELGLAMMGLSRMKLFVLVPISLVMNAFGIFMIGLAARAIF